MWKYIKNQKETNIAHIGDCTYPCYQIQFQKKEFAKQNINTENTSFVGPNCIKNLYERVARVA